MRHVSAFLGCACLAVFVCGCASSDITVVSDAQTSECADHDCLQLGTLIYKASDILVRQLEDRTPEDTTVAVTTMVNLDDLSHASTLGREVSRLVASRLTQRKFMVRDLNFTRALQMVPKTGELILSREARDVIGSMDVQLVAVGSYACVKDVTYVNIRLLNAKSGHVVASSDAVLLMKCEDKKGDLPAAF